MRTIHNKGGNKFRQPVIIEKIHYSSWLNSNHRNPATILPIIKKFAVEDFVYTPLKKIGDDVKGIPPIEKNGIFLELSHSHKDNTLFQNITE
jgi:hypothetical protein